MSKSQINGNQIQQNAINGSHINSEGVKRVLDGRKIGMAREINNVPLNLIDVYFDYESGTDPTSPVSGCMDITEKVYDAAWQASYDLFGIKKGILTTGNNKSTLQQKNKIFGYGFENYKVWIRDSNSKSFLKVSNGFIFGNLFGIEYKSYVDYPHLIETISVERNSNTGIITFSTDIPFDQTKWLNHVVLSWDTMGENIENDAEIGYVIAVEMGTGSNGLELNQARFTFKDNCTMDYNGYVKSVKYYTKLFYLDNNDVVQEYTFPSGSSTTDIDCMFLETQGGWEEQPNNLYNYSDFFLKSLFLTGMSHNLLLGLEGNGTNYYHLDQTQYDQINNRNIPDLHITGKLTVDGLIDPTGLILSEQSSSPDNNAIWMDNAFFNFPKGINITGNLTVSEDATITGNLTVNGDTITQNSETVLIEDNIILLNNGETGAGVTKGTAGIEIDRGTETNFQLVYEESSGKLKAGLVGDLKEIGASVTWNNDDEFVASSDDETFNLSTSKTIINKSELVTLNELLCSPSKYTIDYNAKTLSFTSGLQKSGDEVFVKYQEKED